MRLELRAVGFDIGRALHDSIRRRLRFVLSRFGFRLRRVTVTLAEVRRHSAAGLDLHCRMTAKLAPQGRVCVEVTDSDPENAFCRALQRLGTAVDRELVRARENGDYGV